AEDYGVLSGWHSFRTSRESVGLFTAADTRGDFWTDGQTLNIDDPSSSSQGYRIVMFTNFKDDGTFVTDDGMVSTDFPMIRLADVYLMYAESVVRGGGGDLSQALDLVNQIRYRAFGGDGGEISTAQLTLDFILEERGRELFWEA